jgi:hypothetical protein
VGDERRDGSRSADYRIARISVAVTLSGVLSVLAIGDLLMPGDQVSLGVYALLGVMVLTLLGLEANDLIRGGTK